MSLLLTNTFNVGDDATLELAGASYVTTAQVGGETYVFVASKFDSGVSVFSLEADGTLQNVFNVADNNQMNLGGAFAITTAVVAGTTYLYVTGINDGGVSAFSVAADGALTNVANVGDDATLKLSLTADVETVTVGGTTYMIADGVNDNGFSVFAVGADGHLTNVDNVTDDNTSDIQGPQGIATATVEGNTYVFVTGYHDDGVGVYSIDANGHMTNVFNVRDGGDLELDGPVDAHTAVVGGTTYLFVSSFDDAGVSVFSVAADGHLTNVFNVPDDGELKLGSSVGMSTAVLGGKTYLFVVGADDDGMSVFLVGSDGHLTNVENVSDDATLHLDRPIGVTTVVINGQIYAIVASNNDNGVSVFSLHDDVGANQAPTLTATGNNPNFTEGAAPADLFAAPVASTVEPGQSFTSLKLTVTNVTDGANEILHFSGQDLALTDGSTVGGATVSVVGTTATVTFAGAPDAAALQQLIDGLTYRNTSAQPTEADRVVTITQLTDSGGTAAGGADTAALNIVSTVHVHAANDPATITGTTAGDVTEAGVTAGTPTATGNLDSTDADGVNDAWAVVPPGTASIDGFGTYQVAANGQWTYTLDNTKAAVQALNATDTLTDTFNVMTTDGTTQLVTVTIHGQNDAATITGTAAGDVTEAGATNGTPTATGDLLSTDVDNLNDAWQAVAAGAATDNGFGTYQLTAAGAWTYTLDNANAAVQSLNATDTLTDTFDVVTADGTTQRVTVTIHGQNDAAVITGVAAGDVTEAGVTNGTPTATGNLDSTDVDGTNDAWTVVAPGTASIDGFGIYQVAANGQWIYTLNNANATVQALNATDTLTDTFDVTTTDGTTQRVTVTIHGQNDAAVITGSAAGDVTEAATTATGDLLSTDVDNLNDAWQAVTAGAATDNGFGTYQLTAAGVWTYTLDNGNPAVQALTATDTLTDTFNAVTADGTTQRVTVTIHGQNDAAVITGVAAGDVTEAGVTNGTPTATGNLDSTDVDGVNDAWAVVAPGTVSIDGFGSYQIAANGQWIYTLNNANATVQSLNATDTLTDTFDVATTDGTTQRVAVTIHGQNDAALITGSASGDVTEAATTATGDVLSTDVDNTNDVWQAVTAGAATDNGFGTYQLTAAGVWTYTLDDGNPAVQALKATDTLTDTFDAVTADGTTQRITVTIHGQNDAAVITGSTSGDVTEAGVAAGTPTATGNLDSTDVDGTNDAWTVVAPGTASIDGFGTFQVAANGQWTYTLNNANTTVQSLNAIDTLTDTFDVVTTDGTTQRVTVTIHGQNDAAVITGSAAGDVTEAGNANGIPSASGDLRATDVDNANDAWAAVAAGGATDSGYGTYQLTAAGVWTYTLDNANAAVQALGAADTLTDTFTVLTEDGTTQRVTVTIHGQNDAATITGTAAGDVTEAGAGNGTPTASGNLDSVDSDGTNDTWAVVAGAASISGFGTYQVAANGQWTYTLDNAKAAVQALNAADTLTDTFDVVTTDGTEQRVTVTIHGQNDAAVITGSAAGDVTEAGATGGTPTATGDLLATDIDNAADVWRVVAAGAATGQGFGTYQLTAAGVWTYTLDNANAAVQALKATDTLTDTFDVVTLDGTTQRVTVTIHGQNDAATITGGAAGDVTEAGGAGNGAPTATGNLDSVDIDGPNDAWAAVAAGSASIGGFGTYQVAANGQWTYTLNNANTAVQALNAADTLTDRFDVMTTDGTTQRVTVTIHGQNDAPVNTVPGAQTVEAGHALALAGLAVADPDAGNTAITTSLSVAHGTLTVGARGGVQIAGSGTDTVTLSGSLAQINAALAAGNVVYAAQNDFSGADTLTMKTVDAGTPGALSDTDTLKINVTHVDNAAAQVIGTTGADSFVALPGNERIDASTGIDTVTFDFRLVDAAVTYQGNTIAIDGPHGSHTLLTGVERFVFTDGTVDNADGGPLVDDLFYYAANHDVWNAHLDADAHYHSVGWQQGRDPNAFFSTSTYLSMHPEVKAAGVDPLVQFDQAGWKTGAAASIAFDTAAYLNANPDVRAAGVDPLAHFLQSGYEEGRQPIAPSVLLAQNAFDYVYYLQHNPDVAAAHVDPLLHFETAGWKEGRNPNAFFDTKGYLAAYHDVAAAGINPLDHYMAAGASEGRDPSGAFDTRAYLAANPDVAAAGLNPLEHFLLHGLQEGRSPHGDGLFH